MYEEKAIIVCFFGICFLHLDNLLKNRTIMKKTMLLMSTAILATAFLAACGPSSKDDGNHYKIRAEWQYTHSM